MRYVNKNILYFQFEESNVDAFLSETREAIGPKGISHILNTFAVCNDNICRTFFDIFLLFS